VNHELVSVTSTKFCISGAICELLTCISESVTFELFYCNLSTILMPRIHGHDIYSSGLHTYWMFFYDH
jgi:hypothetical protein